MSAIYCENLFWGFCFAVNRHFILLFEQRDHYLVL